MDEETRHFLENIHAAIDRRIDRLSGEIAAIASTVANTATKPELAEIRASMATKHDLREFRQTMLTYSSHVESLLKQFAVSQRSLSDDVEDLKRRVATLENRLPPEAAA